MSQNLWPIRLGNTRTHYKTIQQNDFMSQGPRHKGRRVDILTDLRLVIRDHPPNHLLKKFKIKSTSYQN